MPRAWPGMEHEWGKMGWQLRGLLTCCSTCKGACGAERQPRGPLVVKQLRLGASRGPWLPVGGELEFLPFLLQQGQHQALGRDSGVLALHLSI